MKSGIYIIRNLVNGKIYIGSAVNLERRLSFHLWSLRKGCHINIHLQRAWDKDGESVFSFQVYLTCEKKDLIFYEQLTMDALTIRNGRENIYNICLTAGSSLGRKFSEATKIKIGQKSKGRWTGKHHSKETKEKMSKVQKGRILTAEHRRRISEGRIGIKLPPFTEEHKKRISEANKRYTEKKKTI